MTEKIYTFGRDRRLVGVSTVSGTGLEKADKPGVLLWNAGLLHRVGPNRLYVDFARKLASMGYLVFRFDLSGLGDSEACKDSRSHEERAVDDIQEAMDFLSAKRGINEFVLMGLCSGADNAHQVAAKDTRVTGAVFLDGYTYPTWGFYLRDYGPGLVNPVKWAKFLKRKLSSAFLVGHEKESETAAKGLIFGVKLPPKKKVAAELEGFIERGMNLLYIYSGGIPGFYNYGGQFKDMFRRIDFKGKLQVKYLDEADHTYTLLGVRDKLMMCICEWMEEHYDRK